MGGLTSADDLLGNALGQVDRDGKTQSCARCLANRCVDADHLPSGVNEGTTAVAWVYCSVGLDVGNTLAFSYGIGPIHSTDDARCDRVVEPKRIADRDGPFTGF